MGEGRADQAARAKVDLAVIPAAGARAVASFCKALGACIATSGNGSPHGQHSAVLNCGLVVAARELGVVTAG